MAPETDYHATIKTRSVETIGNRIQTIVRGYGGRIDNASLQTRYAYLSFVVPKKTFEAFKTELKTLIPARFITESIATQNLLPEKRLIEDKTDMVSATLIQLKKDRDTLETQHRTTVAFMQRQLNGVAAEIWTLKSEVTTDPVRQKQTEARIADLQSDERRILRMKTRDIMQNAMRSMHKYNTQEINSPISSREIKRLEKQSRPCRDLSP